MFIKFKQYFVVQYVAYDFYRVTVAFFALSSLDLLGGLQLVQSEAAKMIDWIYSLQILHGSQGKKSV